MKKVLSLVLVIAMVLSSMSFAFAGTFEDVADTDYEKAINTLAALKVIDGYDDGTFRPGKTITRAEMAKLMVQLLGYGDLVAGSKSNFSDTQGHWADPWIALAAGRGLVIGTGDGKFTPDRIVTYDEAITMVIRGLGYTDNCNELKGTWPTNYKVKAAELKLTKDVKLAAAGADRGGVAQLMYNALEAALVSVDTDGNVTRLFDTVTTVIEGKSYTEQVIRPLLSRLATKENLTIETANLDEDSKKYLGDIVDLAPYMYQNIDAYVNDDDEVVYVAKVHSDILVGEFRTAKDDSKKVNVRIDGKNKLYELKNSDETKVYYNGVEVEMSETQMENGDSTIVDLHKAKATFVLDSNDKITHIIATKYTDAARVSGGFNGKTKLDGYLMPLNDDDKVDYGKLTVTGEATKLEDIEEDDVIVLYAGAGLKNAKLTESKKLTIVVVRDTVEGEITETNKDDDFLIAGKYYSASVYVKDEFEVGSEGLFFLDDKGDIVAYEEDGTSVAKDYAVITEIANGYKTSGADPIKLKDPKISLVNASGDEVTYGIKKSATVDKTKNLLNADEVTIQNVTEMSLVKYTVNSKNEITAITKVDPLTDTPVTVKTTKASFVLANNVLIFNIKGDDVEVVAAAKLGDEIKQVYRGENKNGQIDVLVVKGLGSSDTYAYITEGGSIKNSDDKVVQKLIAYVNGEKKQYEGVAIDTVTKSAINTGTIVKLDLDGDVIEGYTPITGVVKDDDNKNIGLLLDEVRLTRVTGNRVRVGTDTWYTLSDDVAVYVLDGVKFDSLGDVNSVYTDAKVSAYSFDADNFANKVIDVLFIYE